ncbi:hypothetical protein [Haloarcula amylolytica]|uniref:hypothetical protein n=1 Tax=Haloarcula amylolytica TaxID=396317 RepID=UPI003C72466D
MSIGCKSQIEFSGEQYAEAIRHTKSLNFQNDRDLGRTDDDHLQDQFLGYIAEIAGLERLKELGLEPRHVDESESYIYDIEIAQGVKVDVKSRKLWNFDNPDLLVRDESEHADVYVMVELSDVENGGYSASVVGWVSKHEVFAYGEDFLPYVSKNDKQKIDRKYLRDMDTLADFLDAF